MAPGAVEAMLKRRGLAVSLKNPTDRLIFPAGMDPALEDELYRMLKRYSFRLFMRDVIKKRRSFAVDDLVRYSSRRWVERYVEFLLERGVIGESSRGRYRLGKEAVISFGDTLEWFVARALSVELSMEALWGVRLAAARTGGDYDVIAALEGGLVYVEVKSSPPKNVEEAEAAAFLRRTEMLEPRLAIFVEDTRLRMKDKIVPMFEGLLSERGIEARRLKDETFSLGEKVYITNSKPDLVRNIAFCVRHHLRPGGFWRASGP